jgi:HlyD family secretion protein
MKKVLLLVLCLLVAGGVWHFWRKTRRHGDGQMLHVSGSFEVDRVEVSFRLPGWVRERLVSEGDPVEAGREVAVLDDAELAREVAIREAMLERAKAALAELEAGSRAEEIEQAEAAAEEAKAVLDDLLAGARPEEIAAAEAAMRAAEVRARQAKLDLDRVTRLRETGAASAENYDTAKAVYDTAVEAQRETEQHLRLLKAGARRDEIVRARAALRRARARLALVRKGPREETVAQARAQVRQASEALALAQTRLGYARIRAPISGLCLSDNVEAGEFVVAGTPIVTIADLGSIWLRAYVAETDLGRVKVGQPVRVTTDTWPDRAFGGRISFISSEAEFTPKSVETRKERVKLVYRIKITVDNPEMELKPGMPADAEILLRASPPDASDPHREADKTVPGPAGR